MLFQYFISATTARGYTLLNLLNKELLCPNTTGKVDISGV